MFLRGSPPVIVFFGKPGKAFHPGSPALILPQLHGGKRPRTTSGAVSVFVRYYT